MTTPTECYICGEHRPNSIDVHHVVPRRYGGSDEPENLVNLCASCHSAIEKLYDDEFYRRLGVEQSEPEPNTPNVDVEGTKISPERTEDRTFPDLPIHISREDFCLVFDFAQIFLNETQELVPDDYPESDVLVEQLNDNLNDIINVFKSKSNVVYTVRPDNCRKTPPVEIVPHRQRWQNRFRLETQESEIEDYCYTGKRAVKSAAFQRLHCGYCHTVYTEDESADLAAHLRIQHRIDDPYASREMPSPFGDDYGIFSQ